MYRHQIEYWALDIIERVNRNQPIEDTRIELKSTWPTPEKAARRIAGHANAARGESILWLIGVDQRKGVIGADYQELSNWYDQVKSYFESISPTLIDLNIPYQNKTVVALFFETDRAPFVIKNPCYGKKGFGAVEYEVPWRDYTTIRTARRSDLIQILSPIQSLPQFEVLEGNLFFREIDRDANKKFDWELKLVMYTMVTNDSPIIIPFHKCSGYVKIPRTIGTIEIKRMHLSPPTRIWFGGGLRNMSTETLSRTIEGTGDELLIYGSGKFDLEGYITTDPIKRFFPENARVHITLLPVNSHRPLSIDVNLKYRPRTEDRNPYWSMNEEDE